MSDRTRISILSLFVVLACSVARDPAHAGQEEPNQEAAEPGLPEVSFEEGDGTLELKVGADVVGTYVFKDRGITRPHFRNLHAPGGVPVTRAQPPVEGRDATDHADMHPGVWLAFGDINGADVWRNKAKVEHEQFVGQPTGGPGRGTFAVANVYRDPRGGVVCQEECRYTVLVRPAGYLLVADSTFRSRDRELSFGDQEEMGFGVRVATPITVKAGGQIVDSEGRANEAGIWGKPAAWVDYSGPVAGGAGGNKARAGVMLIPDPANAHASRFHVRDYGLMVANPFGRAVFGDKAGSRVVVPAGEGYRMRFAVLLHASSTGEQPELNRVYEDCLQSFRAETDQ